MRIDSHQHFWIYNQYEYAWIDDSMAAIRRDFLPRDLRPELEANGFAGSVVVQTRQTVAETGWLLELADANPWIVGVIGWADLQADDIRGRLQQLASNPKLAGLRHVVQAEPDDRFLLRPEFMRGIAALAEFDLAYDLLIYAKHLPVAHEFVLQFPHQRFVLDHLAKPPIKSGDLDAWARGIRRLAEFPNVFCKLSGLVTEADWQEWTPEQIVPCLDLAFECFGADRLMIGSDWPVCLVASQYSRVMNLVKDYIRDKPREAQASVLGGNAQRFWRLKSPSL